MTLKRVRGALAYAQSTLTPRDFRAALNHLKSLEKGQQLEIDKLQALELNQLGFAFRESGILIQGTYTDELFPAFIDKPTDQEAVVINALKAPTPEQAKQAVE